MIDVLTSTWEELTGPGGPFATSVQEVRGLQMRVFDAAPPHMRFVWELSAGYGDKPYIVFEDERFSYAQAHAIVRSLAHTLATEYNVGAGDRVAIAMRNYPEWAFTYWATICLGAAAVGVNAWWTSAELEYAMADSRPKVVVVDDERLERLVPILAGLRKTAPMSVISVRSDRDLPAHASRWTDVVNPDTAPAALPAVDIHPDDDICIFYTSGTTGSPKGAQLTHRGSVHNLMHMGFANTIAAAATAKLVAAGDLTIEKPRDVPPAVMVPTPLFHVTANNCVLHPCTAVGAKVVLLHKWDAERALELIEREEVTTFTGVPTMSRELLVHPDWATRDTTSLGQMGGGGAAIQPDLVDKIDKAEGAVKPATGYGLTETHGVITTVGNVFFSAKPTSAGRVLPSFESRIVGVDGNDVPRGERGELWVKGPAVIKGYLNREQATAEAIQDGWFKTGDIVYVDDDHFVHIVDRAKDMVLRGGENVYCAEVEAAIYQHPDIAEAAVFGVPDERLGEVVGVAIHLRAGSTLDQAALTAFLADSMAKFKIPERVWFMREPLPQNANGKFLKRELQQALA